MRNETIGQRLDRILDRLTPPRAITKNAEAQAQEVQAMHKALLSRAPKQGLEEWLDGFEERLFTDLKTRAWPTLNEVKKACGSGGGGEKVSRAQEVEMAIKWFEAKGMPHPSLNDTDITDEIVFRGLVQDIREARWRGLDVTPDQFRQARQMRPSRDEWTHHVTVMARLNSMTFEDAEVRERREMSPDQLPKHLMPIDPPKGWGEYQMEDTR